MKKFIKTIVSLTAASAMLLSTTAFAATTKTVTKYSTTTGTTVKSTVSGLTEGSMVTYLAVKGENQPVSGNGDNIVYIGQKTVDNTNTATFSYTLSGQPTVGTTYATVKYGSSVDTIEDTNKVEVGKATVTWDQVAGTVTGDVLVGSGDEVEISLTAASGSEIVKITKNGQPVEIQKTIKAVAGDQIVVTAIPTEGETAVYQLVGAKVKLDENYTYEKVTEKGTERVYTNSGIVRVIGSVKQLYFTFNDGNYDMGGEVKDGHFIVDGVSGNGYYGVEIEDDDVDVSDYSVKAYAVVVDAEGAEEVIDAIGIQ